MDIANFMSVKLGFLNPNIRNEIKEVTDYICHGYKINKLDANQFIDVLRKDKKNVGSKLGLILAKGYGNIFKNLTAPTNQFRDWLQYYIRNESDRPILKGEIIENDIYLGDEQLELLSSIKSKEEIIGEIVILLQSPVRNIISALKSSSSKLSGIIQTLSNREEKSSDKQASTEAPTEEASTEEASTEVAPTEDDSEETNKEEN